MTAIWRVLDTGLASPSRNTALTRALLEARSADEIPSTLRFGRCTRCVLLGYLESPDQVLDLGFCREHAIPIQRGLTNSAAAYIDERQLLWELHLHRRDVGAAELRAIVRRVCHAAAAALSALGLDARYRSPGDIEVDGQLIASAAAVSDRNAIVVQGTLFTRFDFVNAMNALRSPGIGASSSAAATRHRVMGLNDILNGEAPLSVIKHNLGEAFESEFDMELREGDLGLSEDARFRAILPHIECEGWIQLTAKPASEMPLLHASHTCAGGTLQVSLAYNRPTQVIRQVQFSGDIVVRPARILLDLEAALRDLPIASVGQRVQRFFASHAVGTSNLIAGDVVSVIQRAVQQPLVAGNNA